MKSLNFVSRPHFNMIPPFRKYKCRIFPNALYDVFQSILQRPFLEGAKCPPLSRHLVWFWHLSNFSAVAKWCQNRSDPHPEAEKPVPESSGGNEVAPMIVLILFLDVFGTILAGFGSRFRSFFKFFGPRRLICSMDSGKYYLHSRYTKLLTVTAECS